MKRYPPVSIVVPAYNAEKTIAECIEALLDQDYPEKEIIMVDDGSTDKTKEIVCRYPVKLLTQSNLGASAARNNGLKNSSHPIVAYTDSDAIASKDWLKNLIPHFLDENVGAVTGKTIFGVNDYCTSHVRSLDIEERNEKRERYTSLANGPNSAFRKDLLLKIGGFDPGWYHAEDTGVSYKMLKGDYKIVYEPKAIVNHVPEDDWKKFLKKRYRDAKAFTRVLYLHIFIASFRDDYVTTSMKLQPPLFAIILFFPVLILLPYWTSYSRLLALWLLLIGIAISMNIPFSYRVSKRCRRPTFFIKTLLLTVARGFCWGLGLTVGGIQNYKDYIWKSKPAESVCAPREVSGYDDINLQVMLLKRYPPVSVIVPAYNAEKTIEECIGALLDQDYPEKEIIVVNDGSTDDTLQVASKYQNITMINTDRGGAAAATNIGINNSRHSIIVSVDSDAILEKNWLKKIVPEFQDSRVGAVGGYPITANKGILGKLMGYEVESRFDRAEKYVDHLYTMNTAYRKKAVNEAGLFNTSMTVGYDNDMSYKLKVLGYKLVFVKDAKCYHHWHEGLKGYSKQQYNSAYFRLELIKNFKKPFDDISGVTMMLQVPITLFAITLAPVYPLLLVIPFLLQIPITLKLYLAKKDESLLMMPFILYFRNMVWILAAARWSLDSLNPFK